MKASSRTSSTRRSILIVEDEEYIQNILTEGLTDEGFAVTMVDSSRAALETLDRQHPDIVLLDLMLPEEHNGLELAPAILRRCSVPIIAMSASHKLLQEAEASPWITATVSKPFDLDNLLCKVQRIAA
ncbi:MAG TPA: response regulator [Chloroflexota bacterium]|nr:response regulator [Chloroflexota bacterium]